MNPSNADMAIALLKLVGIAFAIFVLAYVFTWFVSRDKQ